MYQWVKVHIESTSTEPAYIDYVSKLITVPVVQVSWGNPPSGVPLAGIEIQDTCMSVRDLLRVGLWLRESVVNAIEQAGRMNVWRLYPDGMHLSECERAVKTAFDYLYLHPFFKVFDESRQGYIAVRREGWAEMTGGKVSLTVGVIGGTSAGVLAHHETGHLFPGVGVTPSYHRGWNSGCAFHSVANAAILLGLPLSQRDCEDLSKGFHEQSSLRTVQDVVNHAHRRRIQLRVYVHGWSSMLLLNDGVFVVQCDSHCVSVDTLRRLLIDTSLERPDELELTTISFLDSFPAMAHASTCSIPEVVIYQVLPAAKDHKRHHCHGTRVSQ